MGDTDVIVIGGGLAGLSCALALCDRGLRVTVLEREDEPGGRARSWTDAATGDRVDIGPHIFLSDYRNLLALLDRLGTRDRLVWQGRRFLTLVEQPAPLTIRTHPLPAPLHLLPSLLKAPQVSVRDLLSNRRVLWRAIRLTAGEVAALDGTDAEEFLRRSGVSARSIDWYWRTMAMTLMNVPLERCSAGALMRLFRFLIGASGAEIGLAGEALGDLYAPAAVKAIEAGGGCVRTGSRVTAVLGDAAATGVRLADGDELRARWCVAALPPTELLPLLPDAWRARHALFSALPAFEPSPYISTVLWFDRKLTRERFWSKTWSAGTLYYDFYDLSNIRPGWDGRASVLACNLIWSRRVPDLTDDEAIAAAVREIAEFAPEASSARITHARVHRIPMAIPAPRPGLERLRPSAKSPVEGLVLAGDWLDTDLPCSMESAVRGGWLAASEVLAAEGRPTAIALPPPQPRGFVRLLGHRSLR